MIKRFGYPRTPKTSLSWDDYYPKSYNYFPSESMKKLKEVIIKSQSTDGPLESGKSSGDRAQVVGVCLKGSTDGANSSESINSQQVRIKSDRMVQPGTTVPDTGEMKE